MTTPTNLREATELLYAINSQIISLNWIGLKEKPTQQEIDFVNQSIGECIKVFRKILDEGNSS